MQSKHNNNETATVSQNDSESYSEKLLRLNLEIAVLSSAGMRYQKGYDLEYDPFAPVPEEVAKWVLDNLPDELMEELS